MTKAAYDEIAEWYDQVTRDGSLVGLSALTPLLELIDNVAGQKICDLACGQGKLTRELARRGATVTGVDISAKLLEIARRDEESEQSGAEFVLDDAQTLTTLGNAAFNGVTCQLALMDIPDLVAVFCSVHRILKPQGWFAFTITHPCFESPHASWEQNANNQLTRQISSYFEEGFWRSSNPNGVRGQVGAYHRTLSNYINSMIVGGFSLQRVVEPQTVRVTSGYDFIPSFLLMLGHKQA